MRPRPGWTESNVRCFATLQAGVIQGMKPRKNETQTTK
jgi:hypothetical protein